MSSGATVRRSITSTEMPSPASCSAAASASCTIRDTDTTVTSVPGPHDGRLADRDEVVGRRLRALHAVEQPVLDEHHRVRVLDGGPQQAVGVGRRRRHHDGQPGDVGEQGFEALRVLAARRAPGAELGAHGERHLGGAAGHERQLGGLVQQLVEADAEEVEVHHLDDRAHPGHGGADAEPDDRRLGDRRVAHPVAELLAQPPGEPEDVAAVADVDAGDEHALVGGQLDLEGGADGVHGAEHAARRPAGAGARRSPVGPGRRSRRRELVAGLDSRAGRLDGAVELGGDRRLERLDLVVADAGLPEPGRVPEERVARLPLGDLLGRPVALRVALVVAVPAVGGGLDEGGPAAGPDGRRRRRPSWPRWRRRRCRRRRRSGCRSRRPAARAWTRAGWRRGRTRRSRCSRRRRRPAAASTAARLTASWNAPWAGAPSPKNATATLPSARSCAAAAAPTAIGTPAATIPLAPKMPSFGSAMCIEPPRPRLVPWSLPISSANIPSGSSPLARQWPWPRWVEVMTSAGRSGQHAPTAAASCPIERCTKPGTSPSR